MRQDQGCPRIFLRHFFDIIPVAIIGQGPVPDHVQRDAQLLFMRDSPGTFRQVFRDASLPGRLPASHQVVTLEPADMRMHQ